MTGSLYVVAVPIGNLGDITQRALETLRAVDVILCEDTRNTRKLLSHFDIQKPLRSYHEHNERQRASEVLKWLQQGQHVALVSDAGVPCISDPGYRLVRLARTHGIPVIPIPGVSAVTAALSVAGLPTDRFVFEGFLPKKPGKLRTRLEELKQEDRTLVLFESVHRIQKTLQAIQEIFGDIEIFVAREMTKLHESYYFGRISDLLSQITWKGEFVLVIPGRKFRENTT